jgi:hypothetical protein
MQLSFFDYSPPDFEIIHTFGVIAELNSNAEAPIIEEMEGVLGTYEGK